MTQLKPLLIRIREQHGFLKLTDADELASLDPHRKVLVRCGQGRFVTKAETARHFATCVDASKQDYVRDISLPSDDLVFEGEYAPTRPPVKVPSPPQPRPTKPVLIPAVA